LKNEEAPFSKKGNEFSWIEIPLYRAFLTYQGSAQKCPMRRTARNCGRDQSRVIKSSDSVYLHNSEQVYAANGILGNPPLSERLVRFFT
jgi:hypothetical protein